MKKETLAGLGWQDGDGIDGIEPKKRQKEMNLVSNRRLSCGAASRPRFFPQCIET